MWPSDVIHLQGHLQLSWLGLCAASNSPQPTPAGIPQPGQAPDAKPSPKCCSLGGYTEALGIKSQQSHCAGYLCQFLGINGNSRAGIPTAPTHTYLQHGFGVWQLLPLVDLDVGLEKSREKGIMWNAATPSQLQPGFRGREEEDAPAQGGFGQKMPFLGGLGQSLELSLLLSLPVSLPKDLHLPLSLPCRRRSQGSPGSRW